MELVFNLFLFAWISKQYAELLQDSPVSEIFSARSTTRLNLHIFLFLCCGRCIGEKFFDMVLPPIFSPGMPYVNRHLKFLVRRGKKVLAKPI